MQNYHYATDRTKLLRSNSHIVHLMASQKMKIARRDILRTDGSAVRVLSILELFTAEQHEWTVEVAAQRIGVSATTAYRYFRYLRNAGLISPAPGGRYTLGPAIIQLDRQLQIRDRMLNAARGVMNDLIDHAAQGATILLCRLFHNKVMCVHQVIGRGPQEPVSYERGRLMPLYRGATSKIILAHVAPRKLKVLFSQNMEEIASAGLGKDWAEFRTSLATLRRAGVAISKSEVDSGRFGIAAPIFDVNGSILGSLSLALSMERSDERVIGRLAPLVCAGARQIENAMLDNDVADLTPTTVQVQINAHAGSPTSRR